MMRIMVLWTIGKFDDDVFWERTDELDRGGDELEDLREHHGDQVRVGGEKREDLAHGRGSLSGNEERLVVDENHQTAKELG